MQIKLGEKGLIILIIKDVVCSTVLGGTASFLGGEAGKLIFGKVKNAGFALLAKGQDKLLTGIVRKSVGQSHSALMRQGTKCIAQGTKVMNIYRGLSSSVGSVVGGVMSSGYNALKICVLGR